MVRLTTDQIQDLASNQANIRNISIIGNINDGKTTLSNYLLKKKGIDVNNTTDIDRLPISEVETNITTTTKLQHNSIFFEEEITIATTTTNNSNSNNNNNNNQYYINIIDTPGHIELSSQVLASLRITDGSLFVVNCLGGFNLANESLLRMSLSEKNKPVLFINKIDQYFINNQSSISLEEVYSSFTNSIESFNIMVGCTNNSEFEVDPVKGTVAFGSSLFGFAFTLDDFAILYSNKFGISKQQFVQKLWGDNYFDPALKRFVKSPISTQSGLQLKRAFVEFILEPINKIISAIMDKNIENLKKYVNSFNLLITDQQYQSESLELIKVVLSTILPSEKSILRMIVNKIPSPIMAQNKRVDYLYQGPMDDINAISISECSSSGPLIIYISTLLLKDSSINENGSQFYGLGRIYSGTLKKDDSVNFINKSNCYSKNIKKLELCINNKKSFVDSCKAGNIVCLEGYDQYISKYCIVSSSKEVNFRQPKYSTKAVFGKTIETVDPKDTPILLEGLKKLDKCDQIVKIVNENTGEINVYAAGQYHLDLLLKLLVERFIPSSIDIKLSTLPIITYKESVSQNSSIKCLAKSANKKNRFYCTAEPLGLDLSCQIESLYFDPHNSTLEEISEKLCNDYGWERITTKNIWAFGIEELSTNVLVDESNQNNLNDIKHDIISTFNWVTKEGAICEESMWGCRFNLGNCYIENDVIVRGRGFVTPTTRRVLYASQLSASPILLEPIYNTLINVDQSESQNVFSLIEEKRGIVISEYSNSQTYNIIAQLPVIETLDFEYRLKLLSDKGSYQNVFSHWLDIGIIGQNNHANSIALKIRERKGLKLSIPAYQDYNDLA